MRPSLVNGIAIIVGVEACLVIAGWVFGIDPLTRLLPFGVNMKFPVAVAFLCSAVGLYYTARALRGYDNTSLVVLPGTTLFTALLMGMLLAVGMFSLSTGIEDLLTRPHSPVDSFGSGWPSPAEAGGFLLFSIASAASLFLETRRFGVIVLVSGLMSAIGVAAVLGYLCNVPLLYFQWNAAAVPVAFNSAVLLILLGIGLFVAQHAPYEA